MAPLTVIIAFALRSMLCVASTLTPICDFISMPLACMVNLPVADLIVMSDSASIVMRVIGAVDDDLVVPGLIDDFDGLAAGLVVKAAQRGRCGT